MANRAKARQLFTKLKKNFNSLSCSLREKNTRAMPSVDLKHSGTVRWVEETILKDHIRTAKNERDTTGDVGGICLARYVLKKRCENLSSRTSGGWR